jgi:hypothetical protein
MSPEPVEVEVLDKDGTPAIPETKKLTPLTPIINLLALVFAVLTAIMIVLLGLAASLEARSRKLEKELDDELPPDPE